MRGIIAAAIAAALCLSAQRTAATLLQSCCACVQGQRAQTNATDGAKQQVLFCAEAQANDIPALETRCDTASSEPGSLTCEANIPGPTCRAQLADSGIFCPTAGAPAARPPHLIALAVALTALGAAAVRRRRSPHREEQP